MAHTWEWFASRSPVVRVIGWVIAWPLVVAVMIARGGGWARRLVALVLAVVVGHLWLTALIPGSSSEDAPSSEQGEPLAVAAPAPEPRPAETVPAPLPTGVPDEAQAATVEEVVNGDTIQVQVAQPGGLLPSETSHVVQLLEIDAPEPAQAGRDAECGGPEAAAFAAERLPVGSTVYLVAGGEDRDQYGRALRYLWTSEGAFFNLEAIRAGHAQVAYFELNDAYRASMQTAEDDAKAANRGIWGMPCDYDAPPPPAVPASAVPAPAVPVPGRSVEPEPDPTQVAKDPAPEQDAKECDPSYPGLCIPPSSPDLDCADVAARDFTVLPPDPHGFDGNDNDGVGCES